MPNKNTSFNDLFILGQYLNPPPIISYYFTSFSQTAANAEALLNISFTLIKHVLFISLICWSQHIWYTEEMLRALLRYMAALTCLFQRFLVQNSWISCLAGKALTKRMTF